MPLVRQEEEEEEEHKLVAMHTTRFTRFRRSLDCKVGGSTLINHGAQSALAHAADCRLE